MCPKISFRSPTDTLCLDGSVYLGYTLQVRKEVLRCRIDVLTDKTDILEYLTQPYVPFILWCPLETGLERSTDFKFTQTNWKITKEEKGSPLEKPESKTVPYGTVCHRVTLRPWFTVSLRILNRYLIK